MRDMIRFWAAGVRPIHWSNSIRRIYLITITPTNFVDPDGRQDKFWQLVGVVEAFIVANVSIFGTVGGTGAEVANGSLNIAGTLGFGATVALKITSIWKGIQAWVAHHHVTIVKSASTTTAGAGRNDGKNIGGSSDFRNSENFDYIQSRSQGNSISQESGSSTRIRETSKFGPPGLTWWRILNPLSWIGEFISEIFVSTHIPNLALMPIVWSGAAHADEIKETKLAAAREEYKKPKVEGSYTIKFSNGKYYHGKGSPERMYESALEKIVLQKKIGPPMAFELFVVSFDWTPAPDERQAFKDEYKRMQRDAIPRRYEEGYENPINYNIIQSKGKTYTLIDGN
jgi:hypothetical protein